MEQIIRGLSNEEYHHAEKYSDYISSTQLKHYLKSPKVFRYSVMHPEEEKNDNLEFGSLFHSAIEAQIKGKLNEWSASLAVFEPPINEKTGQPYGSTTKAYTESYAKFLSENGDKQIVTQSAKDQVLWMIGSLFHNCGETSAQVRKLADWAKEIETSYFYETEEGVKLKVRPDLLTGTKLIDWKTCSCDLDEDSIVKQIVKYRYDVSLAMYQWVLHEITGVWFEPYLVFVNKSEPYESVMVDMSEWCYHYEPDVDFVGQGVGSLEFRRLIGIHAECTKRQEWPGVESYIKEENKAKVLKPQVPGWISRKYFEKEL